MHRQVGNLDHDELVDFGDGFRALASEKKSLGFCCAIGTIFSSAETVVYALECAIQVISDKFGVDLPFMQGFWCESC